MQFCTGSFWYFDGGITGSLHYFHAVLYGVILLFWPVLWGHLLFLVENCNFFAISFFILITKFIVFWRNYWKETHIISTFWLIWAKNQHFTLSRFWLIATSWKEGDNFFLLFAIFEAFIAILAMKCMKHLIEPADSNAFRV